MMDLNSKSGVLIFILVGIVMLSAITSNNDKVYADGKDFPYGIAIDSKGNVFVADTNNDRIQKFSNTGKYIRQWGRLGGGNITTTSLSSPF
jgi:DNA-binding beta-propeller fold protein YncE